MESRYRQESSRYGQQEERAGQASSYGQGSSRYRQGPPRYVQRSSRNRQEYPSPYGRGSSHYQQEYSSHYRQESSRMINHGPSPYGQPHQRMNNHGPSAQWMNNHGPSQAQWMTNHGPSQAQWMNNHGPSQDEWMNNPYGPPQAQWMNNHGPSFYVQADQWMNNHGELESDREKEWRKLVLSFLGKEEEEVEEPDDDWYEKIDWEEISKGIDEYYGVAEWHKTLPAMKFPSLYPNRENIGGPLGNKAWMVWGLLKNGVNFNELNPDVMRKVDCHDPHSIMLANTEAKMQQWGLSVKDLKRGTIYELLENGKNLHGEYVGKEEGLRILDEINYESKKRLNEKNKDPEDDDFITHEELEEIRRQDLIENGPLDRDVIVYYDNYGFLRTIKK